MEMYRDGIVCVAQRIVTTQTGWTMECFKASFSPAPGFARDETQKLELPHR
jgi:hypothetical protein